MDIESKDILKQLVARLDRMDNQQHKLDRVIERLDMLQNIIERQNQKQNLLDQMLVEMTVKPQKENVVTTEQLQRSQQEIPESFHVIDNEGELTLFPQKTTQPFQGCGKQIDDKLKLLEDRSVDTAQRCHQLTSWSHHMEARMTELAGNKTELMKTFLVEIRSVKDLIKGQTNSELIWLNNQLDNKLSDIGLVMRSVHQQQTEMKEETVRSMVQVVKTGIQLGKQQGNMNEPLSNNANHAVQDLERKMEQLNLSILDMGREAKISLNTILTTVKHSISELENTTRNSISEVTDSSREQSVLMNETLKSDLNKFFEASQFELQTKNQIESEMISRHQTLNKKMDELSTDLKDYICKSKREIFAVTEKEAQIVRDRIQGPLPSPGKYTFDFFVGNFKSLIRSGKEIYSLPWHINEAQTCVTGNVTMLANGQMEVWLLYGRHDNEVGLQPRSGKRLTVKATVCDICEKKLPPLDVGEVKCGLNEASVEWNGDKGCQVGATSCDLLLERGYGEQEGYDEGALLIRYEVIL